jgi:hypothetical protein
MVMDAELRAWQTRLAQHFADLRGRRSSNGSDRPIFGLEHGLDLREVQAVTTAVRAHIVDRPPSRDHALPWIVYSSELGYRYSGDEYWQTFELETPGWTLNGNRYWVRDCFRQFQRAFGGAVPSGAWAEHFSIICWPITHAILPKDLQRQLARILYELRHSFSGELLESPAMLGELIAARSWNATSRFQNLAQETQLVGQIAAALLLQGESGSDNLIHPATLRRIGEDLDRERRAREWLRGARRFARERAQVRGLGMLGRSTTSTISRPEEARAEVAALGIEPRLVLRPTDPQGASWEPSIEIPDLSHLLLRFPRTREILTGSRCVLAGAVGRPLARGRCLHGAQRVTLARWPRADEVLLQFEQSDTQLDYLLRTECLLRPGPLWLFRIASDGLAYELRSLRVRPGERYILVNSSGSLASTNHASSIDLQCEGAVGMLLDLPSALTPDWEETLRCLGLGQAKTIEVWPAGLAAVVWDGEGHGEWLASEQPCLAICVDHPIDGLLVSMGDRIEPPLDLSPITPGEPLFVELPQLPVGLHRVRVSARTTPETDAEALGDLDVVMRIREARPWSPGVSPHGPLVVQMEPPEPSLEQMWEGHVEVTIRGPVGRNVACAVSLFERESDTATLSKQLPPMHLPVSADGWRNHFEKHFRRTRNAEEAYDAARFCELTFAADELGAFTLRCEREFIPLRWALRRRGEGYVVRLLDDSGDDAQPTVTRLSFETPTVEEPVSLASEYDVSAPGGMYVARLRQLTAGIIVPPVVRGLGDLGCAPRIDEEPRSLESMVRILGIADLWGFARLPGDFFSATRRRDVLLALGSHATRLICGDNWARAELAARRGTDGMARLKEAVSRRRDEVAIGVVLERDCADLATKTCRERVERLALLITRFHVLPSSSPTNEADARLHSELAVRLASNPAGVQAWAGDRLRTGLTRLMESPTLMRAARFLVLSTDRHLQSQARFDELYAGWEWR